MLSNYLISSFSQNLDINYFFFKNLFYPKYFSIETNLLIIFIVKSFTESLNPKLVILFDKRLNLYFSENMESISSYCKAKFNIEIFYDQESHLLMGQNDSIEEQFMIFPKSLEHIYPQSLTNSIIESISINKKIHDVPYTI